MKRRAGTEPGIINLKIVTQDLEEFYFKCKQQTPLRKLMEAFVAKTEESAKRACPAQPKGEWEASGMVSGTWNGRTASEANAMKMCVPRQSGRARIATSRPSALGR